MVRMAPLYRLPNSLVGWAKVPMGMPPANEVASVGVVVLPGSKASELLHPTRPRRAIANRGARKRAIRRESLKVYVTTTSSRRGVRCLELRTSDMGGATRGGSPELHVFARHGPPRGVSQTAGAYPTVGTGFRSCPPGATNWLRWSPGPGDRGQNVDVAAYCRGARYAADSTQPVRGGRAAGRRCPPGSALP